MPTLISSQETQSVFPDRPLDYQRIQASPEAFGAPQAHALQQVGESTLQTTNRLQALSDETRAQDADLNLARQLIDLQFNTKNGYMTLQGKDAVEGREAAVQRASELRDEIRQSLPNPMAQRLFDSVATRRLQYTMESMGSHAAQQQRVWQHTTNEAQIQNEISSIPTYWNDDNRFNQSLNTIEGYVIQRGENMGWSPDVVKQNIDHYQGQAWVARVRSVMENDPIAAAKMYHDNIDAINQTPQGYELARMLKTTTDAQYSRGDGSAAYHAAIGQATPSAQSQSLPQNFGASDVHAYNDKQIDSIVSKVKASSKYDQIFNQVGAQYGINPQELKLRAVAESGLNPNAISSKGAQGLMQIMPDVAQKLGIDPKNPEQAIRGAATLMTQSGAGIGADMSKIDRAYYGGSTDAQGKNTDQYVENLRSIRSRLFGAQAPAPLTSAQLEGKESAVLDQARAIAEQRRPGDQAYSDKVVSEAHTQWSRDVQALKSKEYSDVSKVLDFVVKGGAQSVGELPVQMQQVFSQLTPQNTESVRTQFAYNQRQARGEFVASDPKLVNDLLARIYLPNNDPQKITSPSQLTPYIAHGVNYTDHQHLLSELKEANNPETNGFMKQVGNIKATATKMLTGSLSPFLTKHPDMGDLAQEASYRFGNDLDQRIKAYQSAGKDVQSLFTPGNPDYVLAPNRVAAFTPSEASIAAAKAGQISNAAPAINSQTAPEGSTARNDKTGQRLIKKNGVWQPL